MTIRELLGAQDELRAVEEELSGLNLDILNARQEDMGLGCIRKTLVLIDGIEKAAEMFGISQLEQRTLLGVHEVYFNVGGVSIAQYRERREDEETP